MPLDYLGSNFRSGEIDGDTCTHGFDNAGFLMGTSSSLFNQALLQINNSGMRDSLQKVAESLLENLDESEKDVAIYKPNPFYLWSNDWRSKNAKEETLFLVDGGEDLQNIPFYPLLQPKRKVDVVIAIDSSADTEFSWPNGTSMLATYKRNLNPSGIGNGTAFPHVPDQNTFVNLRLNQRPTFFGCRSPYAAGEKRTTGPLIIYIPNSPYSFYSNVSTFDLEFSASKRDSIILNGYNVATMGNGSVDSRWPTCVGCAILSRSLERTNTSEPHECVECFESYCWNGTISSTAPDSYQPTLILESGIGKGLKIWNTFLLSMIQIVLGEATFSLMF
jgi:lysophospholipase